MDKNKLKEFMNSYQEYNKRKVKWELKAIWVLLPLVVIGLIIVKIIT